VTVNTDITSVKNEQHSKVVEKSMMIKMFGPGTRLFCFYYIIVYQRCSI